MPNSRLPSSLRSLEIWKIVSTFLWLKKDINFALTAPLPLSDFVRFGLPPLLTVDVLSGWSLGENSLQRFYFISIYMNGCIINNDVIKGNCIIVDITIIHYQ